MNGNTQELSVHGKMLRFPALQLNDRTFIVAGTFLRLASVFDEEWIEGEPVADPEAALVALRASSLKPDLFTFAQRIPDTNPKWSYSMEWDNRAVIPLTTYEAWWENKLTQDGRRNVRLAAKRGVEIRESQYDDDFVRGIQGIYNESPIRQGRRFWHYGKSFEEVRDENATYSERSAFIGAYLGPELVGFIKIVFVDQIASIMQIISKAQHQDKRPTNALLAKAVEVSVKRNAAYLMYCNYTYGTKVDSLTEFKRRNGFEEVRFPRYYVPLNPKGAIALSLGLHEGFHRNIPAPILNWLRNFRSRYYEWRQTNASAPVQQTVGR